jgi:peptidoglycan/xylan/chitin deacetylase (PgdA/CDA1 family)
MRRQDLLSLALYYVGFTKLRNPILRRQRGPLVRFVTYHDVPRAHAANFAAMLEHLRQRTNVIGIDDYFSGSVSNTKTNVVISFDDSYRNWRTIAAPALQRFNLPAIFFVSSGLVVPANTDVATPIALGCGQVRQARDCLTEQDLRELALAGFAIGGHTVNHINLGAGAHRHELAREITADRARLQSITGKEVRYFAYPFGVYENPRVDLVALLKSAGYRGAVTTESGLNSSATDPYRLHRELTGLPMSLPVFAARVDGAYDGVKHARQRFGSLTGSNKPG